MELIVGGWKIRSWMQGDEPAITKYANNRIVWLNLRDYFPCPYTEQDAKAWLRKVKKQKPEIDFAIASNDEAIGGIGLHPQRDVYRRRSAEIGYWVGEPFWRRGMLGPPMAFVEIALVRKSIIYLLQLASVC